MKKKWSLRGLGILFWSVILIASAGYLGYSSIKSEKEVIEAKTPTIALVNEDASSDFNGKKYNFGKEFVNQVSSDDKYEWQVVSRSVAATAFEKGTVDAVIYLPQSFSQDILTFQNINPVKANVEYKVQAKSNRVATLVLQDEIVSALHNLNSDVVEMYYASVANSLAEAENQMNASLQNQEIFVTTLTDQVKTPFENMAPQYGSLVSGTTTLNTLNQSTITAQNSFVTSTTNILKQTNSGLNGQLPLIEQYIKNYNAISSQNLKNAQAAIAKQEELDFEKFDKLNTNILSQLALFYQEQPAPTTVGQTDPKDPALNALEKKVNDYQGKLSEALSLLNSQKNQLVTERAHLIELEKKLYQQFFNQTIEIPIPDENGSEGDLRTVLDNLKVYQTDMNARLALAQKLSQSFGSTDNLSSTEYITQLNNMLVGVSVNAADYQLDTLVGNQVLTAQQSQNYKSHLQLIAQYAQAFGVQTGGVSITPFVPSTATKQTAKKVLQISVPAGDSYQSSALPTGTVSPLSANGIIQLDNSSGTDVKLFDVVLDVSLEELANGQLFIEWTNKDGHIVLKSAETFVLYPKDSKEDFYKYVANDQFETYLTLFQNIEKASQMITLLYGSPGATFDSLLSISTAEGFKSASPDSVYAMYGNIQISSLANRIAMQDVVDFKGIGESNISDVSQSIVHLDLLIKELDTKIKDISRTEVPANYFNAEINDLKLWYGSTKGIIQGIYDGWKNHRDAINFGLSNDQSNNMAFYEYKDDSLYNQFKSLIDGTTSTVDTIASGSKAIENNSQQFENLVADAKTIQSNVQTVIKNANSLSDTSQTALDENRSYTEGFSKILANTRTQGVDANQLFNFFANPIQITDTTNKVVEEVPKKTSDYSWLPIFLIGLSLGTVATLITNHFKGRNAMS